MPAADIFIDQVYINKTKTTDNTGNFLKGVTNIKNGIDEDNGYKWVVAIGNKSTSSYTFTGDCKLQVCSDYFTSSNGIEDKDTDIDLENIVIQGKNHASKGLIYVGWSDQLPNGLSITKAVTGANTLPDQQVDTSGTDKTWVASRFKLYTNDSSRDICGANVLGGVGSEVEYTGIYYQLYDDSSAGDLSSSGSIRRKPTSTYPTTSFSTSDWNISTGTSHLSVSAAGDPHITTLSGEHYKFEHLGAFRLLEDEIDGETLIINGCSEHGKARWSHNEYIKKLYIKHGEKYIYMDTGFRGEAVKVLEESGFLYAENNLPFNKHAKRYSITDCNKTATKEDNMSVTTDLPGFVRNQINFTIDNKDGDTVLLVSVENVNEYNLQPCRLLIKLGKISLLKNAKGCLIDRKYAPVCKLDNIKCMKSLEEPSLEDLKNIPELEVDPQLQNIKWK